MKSTTWESGIKVLEDMLVIVPVKLLHVCQYIADKVGGDEFSIFTNIQQRNGDIIILSSDFYIPKQEVSTTSIKYLPDETAHLYDTVIHRHPNGLNNFSGVDREYINQNFLLSLLYTKSQDFVNGVYNFKMEDFLIPISVQIDIDNGVDGIDVSAISKERVLYYDGRYKAKNTKVTRGTTFDNGNEYSYEYGNYGDGFGTGYVPRSELVELPFQQIVDEVASGKRPIGDITRYENAVKEKEEVKKAEPEGDKLPFDEELTDLQQNLIALEEKVDEKIDDVRMTVEDIEAEIQGIQTEIEQLQNQVWNGGEYDWIDDEEDEGKIQKAKEEYERWSKESKAKERKTWNNG